jgi:hypothetical protein
MRIKGFRENKMCEVPRRFVILGADEEVLVDVLCDRRIDHG